MRLSNCGARWGSALCGSWPGSSPVASRSEDEKRSWWGLEGAGRPARTTSRTWPPTVACSSLLFAARARQCLRKPRRLGGKHRLAAALLCPRFRIQLLGLCGLRRSAALLLAPPCAAGTGGAGPDSGTSPAVRGTARSEAGGPAGKLHPDFLNAVVHKAVRACPLGCLLRNHAHRMPAMYKQSSRRRPQRSRRS